MRRGLRRTEHRLVELLLRCAPDLLVLGSAHSGLLHRLLSLGFAVEVRLHGLEGHLFLSILLPDLLVVMR